MVTVAVCNLLSATRTSTVSAEFDLFVWFTVMSDFEERDGTSNAAVALEDARKCKCFTGQLLVSLTKYLVLGPEDTFRIMLATDNHIGYMERDPVRGQDSINTFKEILRLAVKHDVCPFISSLT